MSSLVSQLVLTHLQFCNNSTTTQLAIWFNDRSNLVSQARPFRSTAPIAFSIGTPRDNIRNGKGPACETRSVAVLCVVSPTYHVITRLFACVHTVSLYFMRFIRRGTETPFVHWTTVTLVSNVSNLHYTVGLRDLETTPTSISARSLIPR